MPGGQQASQPAARGHHTPSVIFTHVDPNPAWHHFRIMGFSDLARPGHDSWQDARSDFFKLRGVSKRKRFDQVIMLLYLVYI